MPKASPPGDRLAMEEALGSAVLTAVREVCRAHGIRPDRWYLVPAVARPFESTAALRLAEGMEASDGLSHKDAVQAAAMRLGLNPDTVLSRERDFFRAQYGGGLSTRHRTSGGVSFR